MTHSHDQNSSQPAPTINGERDVDGTPPAYLAESLTNGGTTARIHLNDQVYSLRITRQGKLILTK